MKNTQLVLVECRNCAPYVYKVVSDKPITLNNVVRYFEETEGWNEDRDSITFVDEVTEIDLDQQLVED
jgi:hypothetical protein